MCIRDSASKGETYESSWAALNGGKNLQGPLYVTCFDGETGKALDTIDYFPCLLYTSKTQRNRGTEGRTS